MEIPSEKTPLSAYHEDDSGRWEGQGQRGRGVTTICQKNALSIAQAWGATPWRPLVPLAGWVDFWGEPPQSSGPPWAFADV